MFVVTDFVVKLTINTYSVVTIMHTYYIVFTYNCSLLAILVLIRFLCDTFIVIIGCCENSLAVDT